MIDPDARSVKTRSTVIVGHHTQTAADATNHSIVAFDVTNNGGDRSQLYSTACAAREAMAADSLMATVRFVDQKGEHFAKVFTHF